MILKHGNSPEDLLGFWEMKTFTADWTDLGLSDDDLASLQLAIMCIPTGAPVIPGTGGLRKLRFSPHNWKTGKRSALRVCYAYFPEIQIVLLVAVYAKNEKDDLLAAEKKQIAILLERAKEYFLTRSMSFKQLKRNTKHQK